MPRAFRICLAALLLLCPVFTPRSRAQTAAAALREIHADGMKTLTEAQVVALSGLEIGAQVERKDLQTAADRLVRSGLFAKVNYDFRTRPDGVTLAFHVEEAPRIPAYFDNVPWFSDAELAEAIRKKLPFYDGTLPEAGGAVDQAAEALNELLTSRGLHVAVEHQVMASPFSEGSVQEFQIQGAALQIARIEFNDPALVSSRAVQQHISELLGKPYSRLTIDLFLSEQVRPFYMQQGYLRAKLGPPEIRLTGNPNQKLPDQIPVFVPVTPGSAYHLKNVQWSGNSVLSAYALAERFGLKPGDVANGMEIEAGWERIKEEYGSRGQIEAKLDPAATYDDQAHTVSYSVSVRKACHIAMRRWCSRAFPWPASAGFAKPGPCSRGIFSTGGNSRSSC
jgi:outer membrane protein assembly factor BamA